MNTTALFATRATPAPAAAWPGLPRLEPRRRTLPRAARQRPAPEAAETRILADLQAATHERGLRADDTRLGQRVQAVKRFQQQQFEARYADLLADRRHARAVRFLADELHGPQDFAAREAQIAGIVPTLVRMFSREVVDTVAALAALHALSESLDTALGRQLQAGRLGHRRYALAWNAAGRANDRRRRTELMLDIGHRLQRHTRDPLLLGGLRMMRGPALLAGLGGLQHFLESGFDAFASMGDAQRLLAAIEQREDALHTALLGSGRTGINAGMPVHLKGQP